MNFVDHGMASNWPVNIHHLLGRVAASGDFGYGGAGAMMGGGKMKQVEAWDQMPTPESAFLGPQLWDRKICMKMNEMGWSVGHSGYQQRGYSDAAHSDSGHSTTPSPTNFHQNYVDTSVHEPHSSNTWATDDAKIHFKMEPGYRGSARDSPEKKMEGFNVSKVDLALATVPGLDFDPTKRSFSAEELKPQPIIKKRKKITTPESKKDDQYWCKRSKNNFAAKRSREARRLKENQIALRASFLEKQNLQLKMSLKELHIENNNMKVSVEAMMSKIKEREVYKSRI